MSKGQIFTIENVLFFSIGVMLVVMMFFSFNSYAKTVKENGQKFYMEKLGEYIAYGINRVYFYGNTTNSTIKYYLFVPHGLSDCYFKIELDKQGNLVIDCPKTGKKKILNLYGIDTKIKSRYVSTSQGRIIIEYKDGTVYLR